MNPSGGNNTELEPITHRTNNEYGGHQNLSNQRFSDFNPIGKTPKYLENKYKNLEQLP